MFHIFSVLLCRLWFRQPDGVVGAELIIKKNILSFRKLPFSVWKLVCGLLEAVGGLAACPAIIIGHAGTETGFFLDNKRLSRFSLGKGLIIFVDIGAFPAVFKQVAESFAVWLYGIAEGRRRGKHPHGISGGGGHVDDDILLFCIDIVLLDIRRKACLLADGKAGRHLNTGSSHFKVVYGIRAGKDTACRDDRNVQCLFFQKGKHFGEDGFEIESVPVAWSEAKVATGKRPFNNNVVRQAVKANCPFQKDGKRPDRGDNNADLDVAEPGQLVEVRRRQWVVTDISGGALSASGSSGHHIVALSSLDEDSIAEEIQVVWQIEPGAQILEKAGLPSITGWDTTERLDAFLDAVRWGAVTNADRSFLQSPFRSGITIEDYQLDPLVRAVDMARVNLLIADDVGLGKTIEAGLVIQELLVRHRARTVLVVAPASLLVKWQREMQEKFGLEFRIVDTEYVKRLRRERGIHVNPWTSYPRLIASMDWMKSGEGFRLLKDVLPLHNTYPRKFDILVVDEAHNIAPAASVLYAIESLRTRLVRMLAPHFTHHLFLSATPHNGYQASFTSLLELLDDQRFARTVLPDEKQLHRVMVRRLKSDILDKDGKPVFPARKLECLEVDYTEEERQIQKLLKEFTSDRSKSVKGTRFAYGSDFVHILLKKRLFSSPMAFANTLAKHRETLERGRSKKEPEVIDDRVLRKAILKTEEEYSDDGQAEHAQHEALAIANEFAAPLTREQRVMLDSLTTWADKARNQVDSKAKAIIEWLETHLKTNGRWNGKRVILFTEYRATHSWLQQILCTHGFGGDRLMYLHGGMTQDEREPVKAAFQAHPDISPVRILLATDAASEGIDLQNHCNYLIHVEIPWNPNVMEQRMDVSTDMVRKSMKFLFGIRSGKGFQLQQMPV